ncbi:MAG: glycosyltransferase family 4 protein [Bacteroidota bacterium]
MSSKILILTIGNHDHSSSRIRAIQYIPLLEKEGFVVNLIPRIPISAKSYSGKLAFALGKRMLMLKRFFVLMFGTYDIVFVHRLFLTQREIKLIKGKNAKIIFDFDDAIYSKIQGSTADEQTKLMLNSVDAVVVASPVLQEYCALNGHNSSLITTPIDAHWFLPGDKSNDISEVRIGWIGSSWTTKYLDLIKGPLALVAQKYPIRLLLTGAAQSFSIDKVPFENRTWTAAGEVELLKEIDIGIMPLSQESFAEGKGGYKLLMYMSGGIPCLASPVGINNSIITNGVNGFLCETEKDWVEKIALLIENKDLRLRLGLKGREIALETYDRPVCFQKLLPIFQALSKR